MALKQVKSKLDSIMPIWMVLFYTFFLGRLMEEVFYIKQTDPEFIRNTQSWFWWLILCLLGIRAGIKYPKKEKIGMLAGLSIIGFPVILIIVVGTSTKIVYYYFRYDFVKYIDQLRQALEAMK